MRPPREYIQMPYNFCSLPAVVVGYCCKTNSSSSPGAIYTSSLFQRSVLADCQSVCGSAARMAGRVFDELLWPACFERSLICSGWRVGRPIFHEMDLD